MDEIRSGQLRSGRTPPGKREQTAAVVADGDWSVYRALLEEGVTSQAAEKVFQRTMELLRAHPGRFVEIAVRLAP